MNDAGTGIEKEAIPFTLPTTEVQPKTLKVKYILSWSTFKTQLPIFKEGSAEDLLHFLYKFNQTRQKLGYTTYQKLESWIEQLLQRSSCIGWNTIKATVTPTVNTLASFTHRIEAFQRLYIPEPAAIENQKELLTKSEKNDKYTVPQFLDHLKHISLLLAQLPGAMSQDCFSADEIKTLFYHSMPVQWQTNFINSGQSLATASKWNFTNLHAATRTTNWCSS